MPLTHWLSSFLGVRERGSVLSATEEPRSPGSYFLQVSSVSHAAGLLRVHDGLSPHWDLSGAVASRMRVSWELPRQACLACQRCVCDSR